MHFEVPKATTFKEFGGEYLMIVISILTALALEHGAQSWHRHHIATQAASNMEAEMHANLEDIKLVLAHNKDKVQQLSNIRNALLADIRSGATDEAVMERFMSEKKSIGLSIQQPSFRREAWEVAVANQAASWMDPEELRRYSAAYGEMRDIQLLSNGGAITFLNAPAMKDVGSNIAMGISNPREIFRMLSQMISAYESLDGNFEALQQKLQHAASPRKEK